MNLRDTLTVYRKELREALRDRRTLISMFLVPAVIMPAIMLRPNSPNRAGKLANQLSAFPTIPCKPAHRPANQPVIAPQLL